MRRLGTTFVWASGALFAVAGAWSFVLDLQILHRLHGTLAAVAGFFVAAVTVTIVPWYAGLVHGAWMPCVLGYGGFVAAYCLLKLGTRLQQ